MNDSKKTKRQLIEELSALRKRIAEMEEAQAGHGAKYDALRESEDRYRRIAQCSPNLIWMMDLTGRFIFVNDAVERTHGWNADEFLKLGLQDLVSPVQYTRNIAMLEKELAKAGVAGYDRNKIITYESEELRRDGSTFRAEINASFLWSDDGKPVGMVGVTRDITDQQQSREALKTSEELYTRLINAIPDLVIRTDLEGNILLVNDYALQISGYRRDEVEGRNILAFIAPEDQAEVIQNTLLMMEKRLGPREYHLIMKDGKKVPFEVNGDVLRTEDGEPFGTVQVCRNIADRKQAQETLKASESRYRELYDFLPIPLVEIDAQIRIVSFNREALDVFGYGLEDYDKSMTVLQFFAPAEHERFAGELQKVLDGTAIPGQEFLFSSKNGSTFPGLIFASTILQAGCVVGIRAAILDISERKQAEETLRISEERFRSLIQSSLDIIVILDGTGSVIYESPSVEQILKYSPGALIGKSPLDFIHPDDVETMAGALFRILNHFTSVIPREFRFRRADGAWVLIEAVGKNLIGHPGIDGVVITARDITERKKAQEKERDMERRLVQAQKMESVGRLAGGVAHDFNNMLSVIIGNTEMALNRVGPNAPLRKTLLEILRAGMRSADLTRQLLAFARKQAISPKVLDLNDTVSGMLKMLRRLIGENIDLGWHPGPGLWKIKIDPSQVDQLLANLSVNARDAVGKSGKLTIETFNVVCDEAFCLDRPEGVPGEYVALAVSDNGCGMDAQTLANIFEPFFTTKKEGQGTGLGLATVYGIVKQNGGFVTVDSEPERGTTFRLYLPRYSEAVEEMPDESEERYLQGGTETILIVEDEESVLKLSKNMLEMLGYKVLTAKGPNQALGLVGEYGGNIDMLLTDVVMPGLNGKELAERLVAVKPGLKCLYMSGYTADVIARQGVLEKGIQFIPKPFSLKDLAAKIRETLGQA